jgi:hypothetical protein
VYQTTTPDRRTGAIADSAFAGNGFAGTSLFGQIGGLPVIRAYA